MALDKKQIALSVFGVLAGLTLTYILWKQEQRKNQQQSAMDAQTNYLPETGYNPLPSISVPTIDTSGIGTSGTGSSSDSLAQLIASMQAAIQASQQATGSPTNSTTPSGNQTSQPVIPPYIPPSYSPPLNPVYNNPQTNSAPQTRYTLQNNSPVSNTLSSMHFLPN